MVNFYKLAMADTDATTTGQRVIAFLQANFNTGPGVTGWIMTAALAIMVFFSTEKRRRAHFERFWYSHHLFIVFFATWQLHGMFCMIKPDRPPYCSSNTIGVFWVSLTLHLFDGFSVALHSAIGSLEASFGFLSVSFAKFAPVTGHMFQRSSNIHPMSWSFRSRRRRQPPELVNTSSSPAPRYHTFNGTLSPLQGFFFLFFPPIGCY